jgi:hypothetical protein
MRLCRSTMTSCWTIEVPRRRSLPTPVEPENRSAKPRKNGGAWNLLLLLAVGAWKVEEGVAHRFALTAQFAGVEDACGAAEGVGFGSRRNDFLPCSRRSARGAQQQPRRFAYLGFARADAIGVRI